MKTATRPNFSDIEQQEYTFDYRCKTCHQTVKQPFLKGLWYHIFNFRKDPYGCQNLIPQKYKPFDKWNCDHDFKFTKDMTSALKCIKCGYPLRFDTIDIESYCANNFFCHECKKQFKTITIHFKKHKRKPFEFKVNRSA